MLGHMGPDTPQAEIWHSARCGHSCSWMCASELSWRLCGLSGWTNAVKCVSTLQPLMLLLGRQFAVCECARWAKKMHVWHLVSISFCASHAVYGNTWGGRHWHSGADSGHLLCEVMTTDSAVQYCGWSVTAVLMWLISKVLGHGTCCTAFLPPSMHLSTMEYMPLLPATRHHCTFAGTQVPSIIG